MPGVTVKRSSLSDSASSRQGTAFIDSFTAGEQPGKSVGSSLRGATCFPGFGFSYRSLAPSLLWIQQVKQRIWT